MPIKIKKLSEKAIIPDYKKRGDAGFDFHCIEEVALGPGETGIVKTGLAFAIPEGYEMQIRLRSGASLRTPLIIPNAPATIDAGYRGEIGIIVRNIGQHPYTVAVNERIAQGIIAPVARAIFDEVAELPASERGAWGYGSTGQD
ncbi:MAG: dUTP diphosphatase [Desulfovibrio sp.]|nr:dUTP diphosphatase [Desulfovibrio sp.]